MTAPILKLVEPDDNATNDEPEEKIARHVIRSRRHREVRAKTLSMNRLSKGELERGRQEYPEDNSHLRPKTRADCADGIRPCPFISCRFSLYADVHPATGSIKLNFPDLEPHEMHESCVLDVADRGGSTLEEAGRIANLTRERVRQIEVKGLAKLQALQDMKGLREFVDDEGPVGKRRLPIISTRALDRELAEVSTPANDDEEDAAE